MQSLLTRARGALIFLLSGVLAVTLTACGGEGSGKSTQPDGRGTVRIGLSPYFEYQPWVIADKLGLDKEQGLDFKFKNIASTQTAALAAKRGDLDIVASCHSCTFPLLKSVPDLQDFMITDQFKGFIVIGRNGQTQTFDELKKSVGAKQAKEKVLRGFKGKTFTIHRASYEALLSAALDQVGLTIDDIVIKDFADDAAAGLAFTRGVGDYYVGSLPQEAKLLQQPKKFVNVGGTDILGPAGLWYSTMVSTRGWLEDHPKTTDKLLAIWYRTMRYLAEKPDKTMPMFTEAINKAAASSLSRERVEYIVTNLDFFATLPQAKKTIYNPKSDLYFQKSVDFYEKGNKKHLPKDYKRDETIVNERYFKQVQKDRRLMSWLRSPLS